MTGPAQGPASQENKSKAVDTDLFTEKNENSLFHLFPFFFEVFL